MVGGLEIDDEFPDVPPAAYGTPSEEMFMGWEVCDKGGNALKGGTGASVSFYARLQGQQDPRLPSLSLERFHGLRPMLQQRALPYSAYAKALSARGSARLGLRNIFQICACPRNLI